MMLLHGRAVVRKTGYSWLSPAILELIAQRRAQKLLVNLGLCQNQPFMEKDFPAHAVCCMIKFDFSAAGRQGLNPPGRLAIS